jgi:hypothetical protein
VQRRAKLDGYEPPKNKPTQEGKNGKIPSSNYPEGGGGRGSSINFEALTRISIQDGRRDEIKVRRIPQV